MTVGEFSVARFPELGVRAQNRGADPRPPAPPPHRRRPRSGRGGGRRQRRGRPFYTMELVDGPTLEELLATQATLAPERVAGILASLGAAVDHLHAAGIVHRDIKASNVML